MGDFVAGFLGLGIMLFCMYLPFSYWRLRKKTKRLSNEISEKNASIESLEKKLEDNIIEIEKLKNVEETIRSEMTSEIAESKKKAESIIEESHIESGKIIKKANDDAIEIAGKAIEARDKADLYKKTVQSMKNQIEGYGDEYLIPCQSLIDDIADEYDHTEAGQDLKEIKKKIKQMIKKGEASKCDYVEAHRKKTAIEFALDAFNGKVDTIISKVKHDNFGKLKAQLEDARSIVDYNGSAFRNARITNEYFNLNLEQLKLAVIVKELKKKDQAEQKAIRDQIREEEKARREFEKAQKEAQKEEKIAKKALMEAEAKLRLASDEERALLEGKLEELRAKLIEAEEKGQRAISMAQQTKRGHVYIISNVGSFGENIFKIGLTRRLEPLDRVKELGDASVPFPFDVHAMIFSEDAPALEHELHKVFKDYEVNKVNPRKEFFDTQLSGIKEKVEKLGYSCHWTMKADALEYRESQQIVSKELKIAS